MIHKTLRRIALGLGGLVAFLLLAGVVVYAVGGAKWSLSHGSGRYQVAVETISIPTDQAAIERGEHLATIRMCRNYHTPTLSGQSETIPGVATLTIPNLTRGVGGVGATNTDADWVRAIRHGVGHDGRGLIIMPARAFYYLSDEDLGALIAYLKSLPPVDNPLPKTDLLPVGRVMLALGLLPRDATQTDVSVIDHTGPRPAAPKPGVTASYGEYLTHICTVCHGTQFNGQKIRVSGVDYLSLNLTPGGELGAWSEAQFAATLRSGVNPSGHQLNEVMPWKYFGQMTDDELGAVWIYLRSLPALQQGN